jgi:hypothetical protein
MNVSEGVVINLSNKTLERLENFLTEDLETCKEVISRCKKYVSYEDLKTLTQLECILNIAENIKMIYDISNDELDFDFNVYRETSDDEKKNMMIKDILEIFPEQKQKSIQKAVDMKKKIDLFIEMFSAISSQDNLQLKNEQLEQSNLKNKKSEELNFKNEKFILNENKNSIKRQTKNIENNRDKFYKNNGKNIIEIPEEQSILINNNGKIKKVYKTNRKKQMKNKKSIQNQHKENK